jgi:hypothetical protein
MPNGRGSLECCYCQHFQSDSGYEGYDAAYEEGHCRHWNVPIPTTLPSWGHRICADFAPNDGYERDNHSANEYHQRDTATSVKVRFSWFGFELKPGVLYRFGYNQPEKATEFIRLDAPAQESDQGGDKDDILPG